ncbi:MAG: cell division protein ZapA [Rhodospirillales bacterium]
MARVEISIRGRRHDLICDDGQEEHLRQLAARLDQRVMGLAERFGALPETRLLVMAGLMLVDELEAADRRLPPPSGLVDELDEASKRLEEIAERGDAP